MFSVNMGKYRPEKLRIWTLFTSLSLLQNCNRHLLRGITLCEVELCSKSTITDHLISFLIVRKIK